MLRKLEQSTEDGVVDWATAHNIRSIKLKLSTDSGWPDRMFLLPQSPVFIEFKRKGKEPTPLQDNRMAFLAALGYRVMWTTSKRLAIEWLKKILTERGYGATETARIPSKGNEKDVDAGLRWPAAGSRTR